MFRPDAPIEEIEQDVESMIVELVHELGRVAEADPNPVGAEERAYIQAFSDARANSDRNQAALLATAISRPNLAESLLYLNRRLDREDLAPDEPVGIIGIIVRLAMDGLWVSDILDDTRFNQREREKITSLLTGLTYLTDDRLNAVLADIAPGGDAARGGSPGQKR
ncbi:TetR family transcriptional regulator [Paenarthrobacter ureafaciens]|uniref:TetR family transcriptional regulator n=1 Tax=Paenarthrobacter ureafaciens TaxID=37931 RepID=UPI001FB1EEDD|nr:TetR family transcriptional regulator [Paenarthrobacter ureafaciens]UOD83037.1 TetR family transcriptional regulator [Paenarthrobacter ureafaciens]WNZ02745.1 TetR family transcriptional regulator [Paenarthrobacter ureafaciens]